MKNKKIKIKNRLFKKPVVIVEITNQWLKIAASVLSSKTANITNLKLVKLSQIKKPLWEVISEIFRDLKLNKEAVITCIPRHLVTVRTLELPSTNYEEIDNMVSLQIGKQTPYSKEEIISAHKVVGSERDGYSKVMLVIARRALINERMEILRRAGIETQEIGISSEGVYNWFAAAYNHEINLLSQPFILLDIDSNCSDFLIIYGGKLVFTRNISIGADCLIEESGKWQEKFIEEVKHAIQLYQNEESEAKIVRMFLSGAGRKIEGLSRLFSARIDIPAEVTEPFKNIQARDSIKILEDETGRFVSVSFLIGAAVSHKALGLDLTPKELRIQKLLGEKRKELTILGILFISVVMFASLLLLINIYNKKVYLEQLKQKILKIENDVNRVEKMRMKMALLKKRLDAKGASINILYEICNLMPNEVHLTNISIEEKKRAILKGQAFVMSDVFKFVTILEDSPNFENVKAVYTTTKKKEDIEYAEFEIVCVCQNQ